LDKEWSALTPDEKREKRFAEWLSPSGVKFKNTPARKGYQQRVKRLIDVIKLNQPDRVPVMLPIAFFPAYYAGSNLRTIMYDYNELRRAWFKFIDEFEMDIYAGPGIVSPGRMFDKLDYKLFKWPGHGLSTDATSLQFAEGEYIKADEYDALIEDPSDFWLRVYLPRVFGAFEPFTQLDPFTSIIEIPTGYFVPYTRPDVRAALKVLLDAGKEMTEWQEAIGECDRKALSMGIPSLRGSFTKAPFDIIGDAMRGTQGIMLDMYQRPDKLVEAMEKITPLAVKAAVASVNSTEGIVITIPLHKGADGFMSDKQFKTFYWPTLKKVILGIVAEGIVPVLFAEGSYNTRLEIVSELPKASVIWWFDQTDMARAKSVLGGNVCIAGNVPSSLLCTSTHREVKEYCRKLIETCGQDGGYLLTGGAAIDRGNTDNLRAMMEAAKEYGAYRR
jgi:uroporphyrinogen-III decarboxylase